MLNSMMINVNFEPENLFATKQEGVIINAIHSQAFLFGDDMGNEIDYAKYREHWIVWNKNHPDDPIVIGDRNVIHHRNENPNNNSPENLIKMTHGEHTTLHNTGKGCSEKTRNKIGNANKGNTPWLGKNHTEESKKKMSDSKSGEKHNLYGIKRPEVGKKISKALKNKYPSGEHYLCGRKNSEETKRKRSESLKKYYAKKRNKNDS